MPTLVLFAVPAIVLVLLAAGAGSAAVSSQPRWVMHDLGVWIGRKQSQAVALNERGQVTVLSETAQTVAVGEEVLPVSRAFLWEKGRLRALRVTLGGPGSWASAINGRGQVVGQADTKAIAKSGHHVTHAFLWEGGRVAGLGTLAPGEASFAVAVNERGQVVGASCRDVGKACRSFLWANGRMTDLGTLGGRYAEPVAINERGQVVGTASTGALGKNRSPIRRAFLWENGKLTDLGALGGSSEALAINEHGQIVSWSETTSGASHTVLWETRE